MTCIAVVLLPLAAGWADAKKPTWPSDVREVTYTSPGDKTTQPALFWTPGGGDEKRPLLVGLHTWSAHYRQTGSSLPYQAWCRQQGWVFIHPNFRGPNWTPDAMGSDLAVADVVGAVEYAKKHANVDPRRIYLIGASGGGHMSLLMAGRHPEIWAGVSSWVPISDLVAWYQQSTGNRRFANYAKNMEKALGGPPETDKARAESARHRSPVTWLSRAKSVPLDINAGIDDGRTGSVRFTHSLVAFNCLAAAADRLPPAAIEKFYADQRLPAAFAPAAPDPLYGRRQPVFRKISGNARVTVFQGGHEIIHEAALNWLAQQRQGQPAAWRVPKPVKLSTGEDQTRSGK